MCACGTLKLKPTLVVTPLAPGKLLLVTVQVWPIPSVQAATLMLPSRSAEIFAPATGVLPAASLLTRIVTLSKLPLPAVW